MKARVAACSVLFLLPLCGPVRADSRQDVMTAVQRCGMIPDARNWLDCYYGAAQPMRGQLGLPPAPLSQQNLVPPASAYVPAATPAVAIEIPKKRDFWDKLWSADAPPVVSGIAMKSYRFDPHGAFTITLLNGQIWRESPHEHPMAGWKDRPASYVVTIAPDDNGFRMHIVGDLQSYQVQRVS